MILVLFSSLIISAVVVLTLTITCPLFHVRSKLLLDDDFFRIPEINSEMFLLFFFCCGKADD
ncbi:hypothetical protein ACJIZ3_006619 [Penstemon smallii]|uniref:Uncharacterized protein n=1 Tax=Penstemon smallii TaxID=265156 RepID=A0ABD3S868_9LAMI